MKDFAKSIVCNTKAEAEKVGNSNKAEIIEKKKKEGATLKVDNGQKLEFSDGSTYVKTSFSEDYREAHNYTGNSRVGNADVVKDGNTWVVLYAEGTKSKEFDSEAEAKKFAAQVGNKKVGNSYQYAGNIPIEKIPDNWRPEFPKAGYVVYYAPNKAKWFATEAEAKRFAESQDKAQKNGNQKVGNADILSGNYIILADNGEVWFRDEHENVHIRNIDSWAQKRIASYQSSIDEIKKGVAEAKQAAKKAGMI